MKKFFTIIITLLLVFSFFIVSVFATEKPINTQYFYDETKTFSEWQTGIILEELDRIYKEADVHLAILVTPTIYGDIEEYANTFYKEQIKVTPCIFLIIQTNTSTCNTFIYDWNANVISDKQLTTLYNSMFNYISKKNYTQAIVMYTQEISDTIANYYFYKNHEDFTFITEELTTKKPIPEKPKTEIYVEPTTQKLHNKTQISSSVGSLVAKEFCIFLSATIIAIFIMNNHKKQLNPVVNKKNADSSLQHYTYKEF